MIRKPHSRAILAICFLLLINCGLLDQATDVPEPAATPLVVSTAAPPGLETAEPEPTLALTATLTASEPTFVPIDGDATLSYQPARLEVTGPEEVVFDWDVDSCEPENIPDIASRAFRDADGIVQLIIGHYVSYRMTGPDLNSVVMDCAEPVLASDFDSDPSMFNEAMWLTSPYTFDGITIYGIVHNEYRGDLHNGSNPANCPSDERLTCLDTSVVMVISTDGGDSYQHIAEPPGHLVATLPYIYNPDGVPSGLRQPSNIIQGPDGFFYVFTNVSDYPAPGEMYPPQWVCLMRTHNLADPTSWRYWNGTNFTGMFINPYVNDPGLNPETCAPIDEAVLSGSMNEAVTFNTVINRYIMVGYSFMPGDENVWGYYYSFSDDLIHWSPRQLLIDLPGQNAMSDNQNDMWYSYPSLMDPESPSMSFDTSGDTAYFYITRFNRGESLDRDLIRFPVQISAAVNPVPPNWQFEGDEAGWSPAHDLTDFRAFADNLSMHTLGADPHMISAPIQVSAQDYSRIGIRMRVSDGSPTDGQLFFTTDADQDWGERKSLLFEVIVDGEYHDYILDLSEVAEWAGLITQLRLDPASAGGLDIDIDVFAFIE
jgi:hypothetical protein